MHRTNNFHQVILIKEWEHKKLRMEIEALQDHLHNLQSIKVEIFITKTSVVNVSSESVRVS